MVGRTLVAAGCAFLALAAPAAAETLRVSPGRNAIQKAVDRADHGDRLLLRQGTYREDVLVTKHLKIVGRPGKRPVIDGRCRVDRTVDIVANDVRLEHLKIKGARLQESVGYTLNVVGVDDIVLDDLVLRESCNGAYYGANVAATGPVRITDVRATGGFADAALYIGSINDLGAERLLVADTETSGNNVGILIEDSGPEANIVVRDNIANDNGALGASDPAGILIRRSDGGRYVNNRTNRNGEYGILLIDEGSPPANNVLIGNRAFGNGVANFLDQGVGTCGSGNSFVVDPC
jgi:hypothetical protein